MNAIVLVANGSEEMETVIIIDALRRAKIDVLVAGLTEGALKCSRGVRLVPDVVFDDDIANKIFDAVILPGGSQGMENLRATPLVLDFIRKHKAQDRWLCAVCASTLVLQEAGVLSGCRVTSYPTLASQITSATWLDEPVVKDHKILTSQGPATCFDFAVEIIETLVNKETAKQVADGMLVPVLRGYNP